MNDIFIQGQKFFFQIVFFFILSGSWLSFVYKLVSTHLKFSTTGFQKVSDKKTFSMAKRLVIQFSYMETVW